jgi:recombination protein RecR
MSATPVREIILATNPTMEGDGTALYLQQELGYVAPHLAVTRLARGLPAGAQIEYSNKAILADAINGRTRV